MRSSYCYQYWYFGIAGRFSLVLLLFFTLNAGNRAQTPENRILHSIRSPQDLIFPHFPRKYCVPVSLSGPVAQEMEQAFNDLDFQSPVFNEFFDGKEFHLQVSNSDYPEQTRDLLSGILNPLEMIDMAVESVVKYKTGHKLAELTDQTTMEIKTSTYKNRPVFLIHLTPRGERFGYSYSDNGAFVEESWLNDLTMIIDTSSHLVYELKAQKHTRHMGADAMEKPQAVPSQLKYIFAYELRDNISLPSAMTLYLNGTQVIQISALYRMEGKQIVFDSKKICCLQGTGQLCLEINYGSYTFKECTGGTSNKPKKYNQKLEKAALLSKKAAEELRSGNIDNSIHVLEVLIQKYGDTPQAVEARRLLSNLPSNLR